MHDTCTQCIWCIAATLSCVCNVDYVAEGFLCSIQLRQKALLGPQENK